MSKILVKRIYSRTDEAQKLNYDEWNSSQFESWCKFQYMLERTALSMSCYKRKFWFELFYMKDNLGDQINKNNFKIIFSYEKMMFTKLLLDKEMDDVGNRR